MNEGEGKRREGRQEGIREGGEGAFDLQQKFCESVTDAVYIYSVKYGLRVFKFSMVARTSLIDPRFFSISAPVVVFRTHSADRLPQRKHDRCHPHKTSMEMVRSKLDIRTYVSLYGVAELEIVSSCKPTPALCSLIQFRSPNLRRLHLSDVLLKTPVPDCVEFLSVRRSSIWPSCFPASRQVVGGQSTVLPRLRVVELHQVKLKENALAALPDSVERLIIDDSILTDDCLSPAYTFTEPYAGRLRELDIHDCMLSAFTLQRIRDRFGQQLTTLKINRPFLFEVDLMCIKFMPNLEVLEMTDHSDYSLPDVIIICAFLQRTLRHLSVARCRGISAEHFLLFIILKRTLRFLDVSGTNITPDIVDILRTRMPDCEIVCE